MAQPAEHRGNPADRLAAEQRRHNPATFADYDVPANHIVTITAVAPGAEGGAYIGQTG